MKILLSAFVTIFVIIALCIKPLRVHKWKIMAAYAVLVIFLFAFYNVRTKDLILPFYKPTNQMFYQREFVDTKEYPDALLPYVLNGKKVILHRLMVWDKEDEETYDIWQKGGMFNLNLDNIIKENGGSIERTDYYVLFDPKLIESDVDELGYLNDAFRYSFFYNDIQKEFGNSFYYYWSYGVSASPMELYISKDFENADTFYLMIDINDGNKYYLVSEEVYNKYVRAME